MEYGLKDYLIRDPGLKAALLELAGRNVCLLSRDTIMSRHHTKSLPNNRCICDTEGCRLSAPYHLSRKMMFDVIQLRRNLHQEHVPPLPTPNPVYRRNQHPVVIGAVWLWRKLFKNRQKKNNNT